MMGKKDFGLMQDYGYAGKQPGATPEAALTKYAKFREAGKGAAQTSPQGAPARPGGPKRKGQGAARAKPNANTKPKPKAKDKAKDGASTLSMNMAFHPDNHRRLTAMAESGIAIASYVNDAIGKVDESKFRAYVAANPLRRGNASRRKGVKTPRVFVKFTAENFAKLSMLAESNGVTKTEAANMAVELAAPNNQDIR